jgi:hypothetical protein
MHSHDWRSEAMLRAAILRQDRTEAILSRHPRAQQSLEAVEQLPPLLLSELMWYELVEMEQQAFPDDPNALPPFERRTPIRYWQRRRRLEPWQRWQQTRRKLPRPWPQLLPLSTALVRNFETCMGVEMLAVAAGRVEPMKLIPWLSPLGEQLARNVLDRSDSAKEDGWSEQTAKRWANLYRSCRKVTTGPRIARVMSRLVLAALLRELSPEVREAMERLSRSTLPGLLKKMVEQGKTDKLADEEEKLRLTLMAEYALQRAQELSMELPPGSGLDQSIEQHRNPDV